MSTRGNGLTAAVLPHRSRDYLAALATACCLAELLLAPLTLVLAALLAVAGRLTRWRLHWLAGPAGAGLVLTLASGLGTTRTGFAAWPRYLTGYLSGPAARAAGLAGPLDAAARDLPRQLPLALLAGAAEAGALLWRVRGGDTYSRPGVVAALRGRLVAASLAAGRTVTADGWALGVDAGTGRRAGLGWADAEQGVLACGPDAGAVLQVCLPAVCAALRRHKALVLLDLSGGQRLTAMARALAGSIGRATTDLDAGPAEYLAAALGQALRRREVTLSAGGHAVVAGLAGVLTSLRDLNLRADALAWVHGCEHADPAALRALIAAGSQAGCSVLLSTASRGAAMELAAAARVVLAAGPVGSELAALLAPAPGLQEAAWRLAGQPAGTFAIAAAGQVQAGLAVVRIRSAGT